MDIFWYTSENTMAIIQQKEGVCMFSNPILSTPGAVTEEGERNTQHGTDVHKKNKRCQLKNIGRNQHAIKVNLSLIF